MKLVIEIPEELYKEYVSVTLGRGHGKSIVYNLLYAIKNSRPLPKGHGDLIDRNEINMPYDICDGDEAMCYVNEVSPIIESDGGGEDDLKT